MSNIVRMALYLVLTTISLVLTAITCVIAMTKAPEIQAYIISIGISTAIFQMVLLGEIILTANKIIINTTA